jgi:hypothetical protein
MPEVTQRGSFAESFFLVLLIVAVLLAGLVCGVIAARPEIVTGPTPPALAPDGRPACPCGPNCPCKPRVPAPPFRKPGQLGDVVEQPS